MKKVECADCGCLVILEQGQDRFGNVRDVGKCKACGAFIIDPTTVDPELSGPDKGLPSLPDYVRYIDELVDRHGVELDVLAWGEVKRRLPDMPIEPSGLWACWANCWGDEEPIVVRLGHLGDAQKYFPIPASMTAAEIARLTVGDCRRMKGE